MKPILEETRGRIEETREMIGKIKLSDLEGRTPALKNSLDRILIESKVFIQQFDTWIGVE